MMSSYCEQYSCCFFLQSGMENSTWIRLRMLRSRCLHVSWYVLCLVVCPYTSIYVMDDECCDKTISQAGISKVILYSTQFTHKDGPGRCMGWKHNVFIGRTMEKLVWRHDEAPAEVSLINYYGVYRNWVRSPPKTIQLAEHYTVLYCFSWIDIYTVV